MADSFLTLNDLILFNDKNAKDFLVSDLFDSARVLEKLAAVPASNGTLHKYNKQTAAHDPQWRDVNAGIYNKKGTYIVVTDTLKLIDSSFVVDRAEADAYRYGPEAFIEREAKAALRGLMFGIEKQVITGTVGGDAAGCSGFANDTNLDGASDTYVVDATGSTASTGSSAYLIYSNADDGASVVIGNNGRVEIGTPFPTVHYDEYGAGFDAWRVPLYCWVGVQMGAVYSVVRIGNLTAQVGKGLTDSLISTGIAKMPAGKRPTLIAMNNRSLSQLQKSRTATNPTGAPAPFPEEAYGVPIVATDAITSTETILV